MSQHPLHITAPGWVGVDLDGTLAHYDHWRGETHIGEPIQPMLEMVRTMVAVGTDVRIFTARVTQGLNRDGTPRDIAGFRAALDAWTLRHIGKALPATNVKDWQMVALYDDRAVAVEHNTGRLARFVEPEPAPTPLLPKHSNQATRAALIDIFPGETFSRDYAIGVRAALRHVSTWLDSLKQKELGDHIWWVRESIPAEPLDVTELKRAHGAPKAAE